MKKNDQDIVIFPGWKKQLEKESLDALQDKRYQDALENIEKLEQFEVANFEILTGKVICFIELGRYEEAIDICRNLMKEDEVNYYKYLHIYVTILFQTSQYSEILSLLDEIFSNEEVPHTYRQQFWQIYDLSKKLYEDQAENQYNQEIAQFLHSLEGGSFHEQWRLLTILRRKSLNNHINDLAPFLSDANLNPVIKTGLLQAFYEQEIDRNIKVSKFNQTIVVNPKKLKDIMDSDFAKQVLLVLNDYEHKNPTLYQFIHQILFRFLYVYYPFLPDDSESTYIACAVLDLGCEYLSIENKDNLLEEDNEKRKNWVDKIKDLEEKYFSKIE